MTKIWSRIHSAVLNRQPMVSHRHASCLGCAYVLLIAGCALESKPPLPRQAAIENAATPRGVDELSEIISRAEIFYLPADRVRPGNRGAAASRIVHAMRRENVSFVLALALPEAEEPVYETCRALLHEAPPQGASPIALQCADDSTHDYNCVAENIVRTYREHAGAKLLVILDRPDIEAPQNIPLFVAQKINVRQLVLDSRPPDSERAHLLTGSGRDAEIVDAAPTPRGDRP